MSCMCVSLKAPVLNNLVVVITTVQAFAKLQRLERLYLQHNNLTRIPQNLPRSLRDLRINHNSISKVQTMLSLYLITVVFPKSKMFSIFVSDDNCHVSMYFI